MSCCSTGRSTKIGSRKVFTSASTATRAIPAVGAHPERSWIAKRLCGSPTWGLDGIRRWWASTPRAARPTSWPVASRGCSSTVNRFGRSFFSDPESGPSNVSSEFSPQAALTLSRLKPELHATLRSGLEFSLQAALTLSRLKPELHATLRSGLEFSLQAALTLSRLKPELKTGRPYHER